jgi:hypothetical protein
MPSNFMTSHHIPRDVLAVQQPKGEDIFEGNVVSDVLNLSNWGAMIVVVKKLAGAAGTATFGIEACDDIVPATSPAITGGWWYRYSTATDVFSAWTLEATASTTITAGAEAIWEFYVPSSILEGTTNQYNYKFIRWALTEVDSTAVDGMTVTLLVDPKVAEAIPTTVLA